MNAASISEIHVALSQLRTKHKQLVQQAAKLAESIAVIEETFDIAPQRTVISAGLTALLPVNTHPYRGMTIGEAAIQYLRSEGEYRKTRNISDALAHGGLQSSSENLYRTVYNSLKGRDGVVLKDAKWGLTEWDTVG